MEKNKKKKFRDIRNAVVMMCVMVAMMSTASYAWFTLSDSPTVTGMQMTAATSGGGLMVANVVNGSDTQPADSSFANAIEIADDNEIIMLKPVTPVSQTETKGFYAPVYVGANVDSFTEIAEADLPNYIAKYEYWVKSMDSVSSEMVGVGIICGATGQDASLGLSGDKANANGSLVRKTKEAIGGTDDASTVDPSLAIRVGFTVSAASTGTQTDGVGKLFIWQPNSEITITQEMKKAGTTGTADGVEVKGNLQSKSTGEVVEGGTGNTSNALFSMSKGGAVKVTMYVWLEGSDNECANEIQTGDLEAQVQFTTVGATTTP